LTGHHNLPDLDDPKVYEETDPQGAHRRLFDLPDQCRTAWDIAMNWTPPVLPIPPRAVVIVGMGGSAIGGDLLRALSTSLATIPIVIHRDYELPNYTGPHTLVIASSYSGNTEETLSAAQKAHDRGAPLVAITTDGTLSRRAEEWGASLLSFDYRAQPRESLGYSMLLLLGSLVRLDLLPDMTPEVRETAKTLAELCQEIGPQVPLQDNPFKQLAHWLYGHMVLICGAGLLSPVARRWKCQINEISKAWACFEEIPEMDHNAVTGTSHPAGFGQQVRAIFLTSAYDHHRNRQRQCATQQILEEEGIKGQLVAARGNSLLSQILTSILQGDATSYYLAMLYQADPTPIPAIDALKKVLAQAP
jgi:glucose/mannose-6-phosphate isomerase